MRTLVSKKTVRSEVVCIQY